MKDAEVERLSTQEKLAQLAPGFGGRVERAVDTFPSIEAAAAAIGLGHNQLRRIIAEKAVPSFPAISLLAKKSGYRLEWIAFGELPEKNAEPVERLGASLAAMLDRFAWIPEYDVRAAAGHGAINDEMKVRSLLPVPLSLIQSAGVKAESLRIIRATGVSMEPDIMDGDNMVIVAGEETIHDGKIYAINVGDDLIVKQVQLEPDGGITLVSRNPTFPPRKIGKADRSGLSIAGRLLFSLKRFT